MKINNINSFTSAQYPVMKKSASFSNKITFGEKISNPTAEDFHQKIKPELDTLVEKALRERTKEEIQTALFLLEKALKYKDDYYRKIKAAKGDLGHIDVYGDVESTKIHMANFYNAAVLLLLNGSINVWTDEVQYGYISDPRRTDDGCTNESPIELRVKNCEYLKEQLENPPKQTVRHLHPSEIRNHHGLHHSGPQ